MRARIRALIASMFTLLAVASVATPAFAQPRRSAVLAAEPASIRTWDATVDAMLRSGDLQVRHAEADTLLSGRTHVRLQQFHRGVPVYGAVLTRQTDDIGATLSIFGTTYSGIDVDVRPVLTVTDAAAVVAARTGVELGPERPPTLLVLPVMLRPVVKLTVPIEVVPGALDPPFGQKYRCAADRFE